MCQPDLALVQKLPANEQGGRVRATPLPPGSRLVVFTGHFFVAMPDKAAWWFLHCSAVRVIA